MSVHALEVESFVRLFKALADETRLRIVALLAHGELCVCHLEHALRLSQPKVSRHLGSLRSAGIVAQRRAGTWVYYRLARQADPGCERQLHTLVRAFARHAVLRRDRQRLLAARGPQACS